MEKFIIANILCAVAVMIFVVLVLSLIILYIRCWVWLIRKLWRKNTKVKTVSNDLNKYKTALQKIMRETDVDSKKNILVIRNFAGYALYGKEWIGQK